MAGATGSWSRPLRLLSVSFHVVLLAASEADHLIQFKNTLSGAGAALQDWAVGAAPCVAGRSNWTGVICEAGGVYGLQLENLNLQGNLDLRPLVGLKNLRTLSFMNNRFTGNFPSINKLGALKAIYLSNNNFSGEIADEAFEGMGSLKTVYLSVNGFSGNIPGSLAELPRLMKLRLDGNGFFGEIPEFRQPELKLVNLTDNDLSGPIPPALRKMNAGSFAGNKALCGPPLGEACPPSPSTSLPPAPTSPLAPSTPLGAAPASPQPKKPSSSFLILIVVATAVFLVLIAGFAAAKLRRRREFSEHMAQPLSSNKMEYPLDADRVEQGLTEQSAGAAAAGGLGASGKLVFLREGGEWFEMQDLLKASAEVLGSGGLGSSYKAVLLAGGPAIVVKRFKEMNGVGREEFCEHMRRLGRLSHPNLLPLTAYYYRKDEKLLLTPYVINGSLAHLLHGKNEGQLLRLDWAARVKIIKGVAGALSYLYEELPMLAVPHGHLKSSNVLLDGDLAAVLSDYSLAPVMNKTHASNHMAAYWSPELRRGGSTPTNKSDVWSLGVLILELLTGKPAGGEEEELVVWMRSAAAAASEKGELFDPEVAKSAPSCGAEEVVMKLLQLGLACCEIDAARRPGMAAAAEKIQRLEAVFQWRRGGGLHLQRRDLLVFEGCMSFLSWRSKSTAVN